MKTIKALLACACFFACAHAVFAQNSESGIKEQKVKFSATAFMPSGKQPYISVSSDGRTMKLECSAYKQNSWIQLFKSKEGFFRPSTDYRISFNYKISSLDEGATLVFRIRESDGNASDTLYTTFNSTDEEQSFTARFRTPNNAKKLIVAIIAVKGSVSAEIKDLKFDYGNFETYIPASAKALPFEESELTAPLPTGAEEFSVDLPNLNGSAISVEHLDVSPEFPYLASRINKAIQTCAARGITKLTFPKGVYYIDEDVPITLSGLKDFELDGNGSTFVFKRNKGNSISVWGCERVKICNLNFDWDWGKDPLGSFVKVSGLKSAEKESYVDFTFVDYKEYPLQYIRIACLSAVDEKSRSVGIENGRTYMWETWRSSIRKEKKWVAPNVLRVYLTKGEAAEFSKGEFFRMIHYYYDMNCFNMGSNKHLTLENINIYSTPGHAFSVDGAQKYWQFQNVNIVIPEGESKRAITCTADHLHIVRSQGYFKMENCDFSFGNDDCVNAHDNSDYVKKFGTNTVALKGKWRALSYKPSEKVEFRNTDMSPTGFTSEVVSVAESDETTDMYCIKFKDTLPEDVKEFVLFNKTYDTSNIIMRNCIFRQNRARGILILARNVTVENCKFFRNEMGGIKLESGWTYNSWCEGYGVSNVLVKNCEFDTVNPSGMANDGKVRDIFIGAYTKTDPSKVETHYPVIQDVLFENNRFKDCFGAVAFISSAQNITFKNNIFLNETARNSELYYRGAFFITHASKINILNNVYIESALLKKPGVMFDTETCKEILAEGNVITKSEPKTPAPPPQDREYDISNLPNFFP